MTPWEDKGKKSLIKKKDYVKDIKIFNQNQTGILRNCFPILLNENEVKIVFDWCT